jgi:hypothetical protein
MTEQAAEKAKEKPTERVSKATLVSHIRGLEATLEKQRQGGRALLTVKKDFTESKKSLDRFKNLITRLTIRSHELEKKLAARLQKKKKFVASLSKQTKMFFNAFLSQKGFAGTLEFDHNEKTLNIKVQVTTSSSFLLCSSSTLLFYFFSS